MKDNKDLIITVRLSKKDNTLLSHRAANSGMKKSDYLRNCLRSSGDFFFKA